MMLPYYCVSFSPASPGKHVLVLNQYPSRTEPLGHGDDLLHVADGGRGALKVEVDYPVLRDVGLTGPLGDDGGNSMLVPINLILVWEVDCCIIKIVLLDPLLWRLNSIMNHLMVVLQIVIVSNVSDYFILSFGCINDLLLRVYIL